MHTLWLGLVFDLELRVFLPHTPSSSVQLRPAALVDAAAIVALERSRTVGGLTAQWRQMGGWATVAPTRRGRRLTRTGGAWMCPAERGPPSRPQYGEGCAERLNA